MHQRVAILVQRTHPKSGKKRWALVARKKVKGKRTYKCTTCRMPKAPKRKLKCRHPKKYRNCVNTQVRAGQAKKIAVGVCRRAHCKKK